MVWTAQLRQRAGEIGLAALAIEVGVDVSNLAKVLKTDRAISASVGHGFGSPPSTSG